MMQLNSVVVKSTDISFDYKGVNQSKVEINQSINTNAEVQKKSVPFDGGQLSFALRADEQNKDEKDGARKLKIENTIETVNKFLEPIQTSIQFKLHEKTSEYFVQVVNRSDGEVIREIPSEQMLDLRYAFEKYIGILVDEKI